MRIRDAEPGDWPAIWRFAEPILAAGEHFTWENDQDWMRSYWMDKEPPGATLVAELDGAVAATAEIHPNQPGRGSHVANAGFIVDPAHRGRGLGRALGEAVIARAARDGFRAMQFNAVVATNTVAVDLWHSLGFTTVAVVPKAFRHPSHGLVGLHIMHRELST